MSVDESSRSRKLWMSGHALTWWSELLMARFAAAGVTDVVISPGSRSTAFVLAADRNPDLRCHTCLDERSAGFFALGLGRATGRPALLVCTSGTAPAHYYPAVIEASQSRIPLLVLSADRPLELVDCAAPQTIDQVKMFGDHVRSYVDLGLPDRAPRALRGIARAVEQAVLTSRWPAPGAVHLNARARKPFEPEPAALAEDEALEEAVRALAAMPRRVFPALALPDPAAISAVAERVRAEPRGVILAGPAPVTAARRREVLVRLARATGYPVLAESTSQARSVGGPGEGTWVSRFDVLLGTAEFRRAHAPGLVLQVGAPPTSGGLEPWLDEHLPERAVFAESGWNDWLGTATHLVFGEVDAALEQVAAAVGEREGERGSEAWRRAWAEADAWAAEAAERVLAAEVVPTEAHAARAVVQALPAGGLLALGNSLPVRLVDWYTPALPEVGVLSQRGANGIDGLIAGAAGSVAATGRPCVLLLGDVSAVHDLNGLLCARELPAPLVVVVVDNEGGRIFDLLPVAGHPAVPREALRHLHTPHGVDFVAAAAAHGLAARRVDPSVLGEAIGQALREGGCTLLHVPVSPDRAAPMLRAIRSRLAERFAVVP